MDIQSIRLLSFIGIPYSPKSFVLPPTYEKNHKLAIIWQRRLEIVLQYLENQIDILLSDADAVWIRDPFPLISDFLTHSDIIASRGSHPTQLTSQWGSTLCMGFIYFKSSLFSRVAISQILNQIHLFSNQHNRLSFPPQASRRDSNSSSSSSSSHIPYHPFDDQHSLNFLLSDWGVRWEGSIQDMNLGTNTQEQRGQVLHSNTNLTIAIQNYLSTFSSSSSSAISLSQSTSLSSITTSSPSSVSSSSFITLLPHSLFYRKCHSNSTLKIISAIHEGVIIHCKMPTGEGLKKLLRLDAFSLHRLRADWVPLLGALVLRAWDQEQHQEQELMGRKQEEEKIQAEKLKRKGGGGLGSVLSSFFWNVDTSVQSPPTRTSPQNCPPFPSPSSFSPLNGLTPFLSTASPSPSHSQLFSVLSTVLWDSFSIQLNKSTLPAHDSLASLYATIPPPTLSPTPSPSPSLSRVASKSDPSTLTSTSSSSFAFTPPSLYHMFFTYSPESILTHTLSLYQSLLPTPYPTPLISLRPNPNPKPNPQITNPEPSSSSSSSFSSTHFCDFSAYSLAPNPAISPSISSPPLDLLSLFDTLPDSLSYHFYSNSSLPPSYLRTLHEKKTHLKYVWTEILSENLREKELQLFESLNRSVSRTEVVLTQFRKKLYQKNQNKNKRRNKNDSNRQD